LAAVSERTSRETIQRELRNESGAIMRSVEQGESFTITDDGIPIRRLIPLRRRMFVPREGVLAAFAHRAGSRRRALPRRPRNHHGPGPFDRAW
jgi:antitoxin (DNA-binding transcriptional repressor) of toxin-antitoxin stability system